MSDTTTMVFRDGSTPQVHLPDASTVLPDSSGQYQIPTRLVPTMIAGGMAIVTGSGDVPPLNS